MGRVHPTYFPFVQKKVAAPSFGTFLKCRYSKIIQPRLVRVKASRPCKLVLMASLLSIVRSLNWAFIHYFSSFWVSFKSVGTSKHVLNERNNDKDLKYRLNLLWTEWMSWWEMNELLWCMSKKDESIWRMSEYLINE